MILRRLLAILISTVPLFWQQPQGGVTYVAAVGGGTPTLAQIIGKGGIDRNRGGSTTAANAQIWNFDSTGARVLTSGSMIAMTGTWINNPTTGGGYHATCTAPCAQPSSIAAAQL